MAIRKHFVRFGMNFFHADIHPYRSNFLKCTQLGIAFHHHNVHCDE
jgi:hypothetical protein